MSSVPLDPVCVDDAVLVGAENESDVALPPDALAVVKPLASEPPNVKAELRMEAELDLASIPQGPACGSAGLMSFCAWATCVQFLHR